MAKPKPVLRARFARISSFRVEELARLPFAEPKSPTGIPHAARMRRYSVTAQLAHYFESIVSKKEKKISLGEFPKQVEQVLAHMGELANAETPEGESYRAYLKTIHRISSDTSLSDEEQGDALNDASGDSPMITVIAAISPEGTDTFKSLHDIVSTSELFMASQQESQAEA